ncbi:lysophospholipid acyltransferase 1-like protein [Tanacetum coccineum]|uniref:Lysophospholipid acyltransferase 1-like protein n=1 Tax=Tanacetum coccineum TaxID=301880 RepID=A0ABQ4Y745_9ASTR
MSKVLQERGSGSLPSSTKTNPRNHVKSITTTEEAEALKEDDKMQLIKLSRVTIPFPVGLRENRYDKKEVLKELKKLQVNSKKSATSLRRFLKEKSKIKKEIKAIMNVHCSTILKDDLPSKEKDLGSFTLPCYINNMCFDKALADLGASISVMPYSTFTNLGLGKLAPTKLIIELADKSVKRPKGIAENVLVGIDKFVFPIDFIVLDMPEDIKILLILGSPFLSTTHAKIDVFKKIGEKCKNHPCGLRERMELDLEAILMGDVEFGDFIELNDLIEPLELNDHEMEDLDPEIEECEIIDEPKVDFRHDYEIVERIDEYPSFCDYDRKIHFAIVENIDAYRDKDMGDVIVRKPFCRVACVEAKRIDGFITIRDGNDSVTYQMVRSHPWFKYISNE